jgi:signal transduction histidine kinase
LTLVTSHIKRGFVDLSVDLADDLPLINGLRGQLEDVWLNLFLNARDAVAEQEEPKIGIRSRLSPDGTKVEVSVWDNGPGIPEDQRELIFAAFYTTKPRGQGTGLGLHICRQIVEKCSGQITVQNNDYGQRGSSFLVSLPVFQQSESEKVRE